MTPCPGLDLSLMLEKGRDFANLIPGRGGSGGGAEEVPEIGPTLDQGLPQRFGGLMMVSDS